jgi:KDO2-lipid IV(A) lauroyltransferase
MAHFLFSKSLSQRIERIAILRRILWAIEAGLLGLFWGICACLPPDKASNFGRRLLGRFGPGLRKSKYMLRNLQLAFPELSEEQRSELLREVWGNTGAVFGEYPHLAKVVKAAYDKHFEVDTEVDLEAYRSGGKRAIFVTGHFGNWEMVAGMAALTKVPLTVVYTPIKNVFIDRMLKRRREALGCQLLDRNASLPQLIAALDEGRALGLIVDHRDDGGIALPFFGLDKLTTVIPARLALRFGCDLIPVRAERLNGTEFRFRIFPPIQPDPDIASPKDRAVQMMTEVNGLFERWIRERPEQWLCTKRAWAKDIVPEGAPRQAAVAEGAATPQTET